MRTTVSLEDRTLELAKQRAREAQVSLSEYVEMAVLEKASRPYGVLPETQAFPTFKGGSLLPGVDLNDSKALADLMDNR